MSTPVKLAIVYYSSTGTITEIAKESNPAWAANHAATRDIPEASAEDIEWADAVLFGSPTRFGNVSAQLKQFIDGLGGLWAQGKLADKVDSCFVSSATAHGGHLARRRPGQRPRQRDHPHRRSYPGRACRQDRRTAQGRLSDRRSGSKSSNVSDSSSSRKEKP